jgi:hypothetical protein
MLERWTDASDLMPFADRHEPGPMRMPLEYVDTEARVARLYDDYVSIGAVLRESMYVNCLDVVLRCRVTIDVCG